MEWFLRFLKSEDGQATTEYMLILAIVSGMLVMLVKKLIQPSFQKLIASVNSAIQKQLFGMDMHVYRVRR
jgi:Flp pilus assembly pilin Flp